jgi:hypothetical protein
MAIGIDDAILVGAGALVGAAVGAIFTKVMDDDDAPTVGDPKVTREIVGCTETKALVKITVSEDSYWYQDDTGLSQIQVTGEDGQSITLYPHEPGSFQEDFEFWVTHKNCRSETAITVVPQDKASNQQGYRKVLNVTPPHCCNSTTASANNCNCSSFDRHELSHVSVYFGQAESD